MKKETNEKGSGGRTVNAKEYKSNLKYWLIGIGIALLTFISIVSFGQITLENSGNDINIIKNSKIEQGFHKSQLTYSTDGNRTIYLYYQGKTRTLLYSDVDVPSTANISVLTDTLDAWIGKPITSTLQSANGNEIVINDSGQLKVVLDGKIDTNNSTTTLLDPDEVYTGWASSTLDYAMIIVNSYSDVASATDGLQIQFSVDSLHWHQEDVYTIPALSAKFFTFPPSAKYYRVKYTNGGTIQTDFELQSILKKTNSKPSSHRIQDAIIGDDDAELTKSVLTGLTPNGVFKNVNVTNGANLKISLEELETGVSSNSNSQLNVTPYFSDGQEYKQSDGKLRTSSVPYTYDIVEGNIADHFALYKFGSNPSVGLTEETIWTDGGLYDWTGIDAAAGIVKISSTDDNDSINGSGARTCTIYGLSSVDSTACVETVTLDGQTPVNSTLSYYRINRIIVNTAGTSLANEGKVYVGTGTVTNGVPAVKWAVVEVGLNQTLQTVWTVPADKVLYVTSYTFGTDSNKGDLINIYVRPPNELFQIKTRLYLFNAGGEHTFEFPFVLQAGTDIDVRAIGTAGGAGISFAFEGWYE